MNHKFQQSVSRLGNNHASRFQYVVIQAVEEAKKEETLVNYDYIDNIPIHEILDKQEEVQFENHNPISKREVDYNINKISVEGETKTLQEIMKKFSLSKFKKK